MTNNPISSWTTYVRLRRQDGARVMAVEIWSSFGLASAFAFFWLLIGAPNSFGKDGLIDGLGSITTVLAGFYVAGLVAIATFFRENSSLDEVITSGPAILDWGTIDEEHLTRRQYVCSIFGFLVALSFILAISAVVLRSSSRSIVKAFEGVAFKVFEYNIALNGFLEIAGIFTWVFVFIWQVILTLRGLYYLMDRIYDVTPILGKPPEATTEDDQPRPEALSEKT